MNKTKNVQEYKRKCTRCGKIWYSDVKQEKKAAVGGFLSALVGVGTALSGNLAASTQSQRNADAQMQALKDLKKCPKCGSSNYTEKIVK